jgi:hypothetical protein
MHHNILNRDELKSFFERNKVIHRPDLYLSKQINGIYRHSNKLDPAGYLIFFLVEVDGGQGIRNFTIKLGEENVV